MADSIKVDTEGLLSHAQVCDAVWASLDGAAAPAGRGHLTQASTAAVAHGNGLVQAVTTTLSRRAIGTGDTLRTAAGGYVTTDGDSGQAIATTVRV